MSLLLPHFLRVVVRYWVLSQQGFFFLVFFLHHFEYVIPLPSVMQRFCWDCGTKRQRTLLLVKYSTDFWRALNHYFQNYFSPPTTFLVKQSSTLPLLLWSSCIVVAEVLQNQIYCGTECGVMWMYVNCMWKNCWDVRELGSRIV